MTEVSVPEFVGLVDVGTLTIERLSEWKQIVSADAADRRALAAFVDVQAEAASKLRSQEKVNETCLLVGSLEWVLARFEAAAESLARVKRNDFARRLEGDCHLQLGRYTPASQIFSKLAAKQETLGVRMALVESLTGKGELAEAQKILKSTAAEYADQAEWHYQSGMLADTRGDKVDAIDDYQKALELDPEHTRAMFRLAFHCDLAGDDEEALSLYERCVHIQPIRVNALVNLGLLYEDMGRYSDAARCFRQVLQSNPNHERARLFMKDARASLTMYYDEEQERQVDRRNKVLEIPVTDFELSVRARNCLERMNVMTLGHLIRVTEQELLSYKNFGETSLNEVKQMMASKGLRLGQALEKEPRRPRQTDTTVRPTTDPRNMTIAELELSVRSRKCMQSIGLQTVGDLCACTEAELTSSKNFGQTSLNEVRQKLAELNLELRQD